MSIEEFAARCREKYGWRWAMRVWWERIKLRRMIRRGWRPTVHDACMTCIRPIAEPGICVRCGGTSHLIADSGIRF